MALSQITVIAVLAVIAILVGILVVYARTLANKVGKTYATLRRIEEVLIAANAPRGHASGLVESMEVAGSPHGALGPEVQVREMPQREMAVPDVLLAEGAVREMSALDVPVPERDRRVSYLTVRDLKVMSRSGRRHSDLADAARVSSVQVSVGRAGAGQVGAGQADAGLEPTGLSSSSAVVAASDEVVAEAREEVYAYSELSSAPIHRAASEPDLRAMHERVSETVRELAPAEAAEVAHEPASTEAPESAYASAPEASFESASGVGCHPAPTEAHNVLTVFQTLVSTWEAGGSGAAVLSPIEPL